MGSTAPDKFGVNQYLVILKYVTKEFVHGVFLIFVITGIFEFVIENVFSKS